MRYSQERNVVYRGGKGKRKENWAKEEDGVRLEPRMNTMGPLHTYLVSLLFVIACASAFVASTFAVEDMLHYDEGDVYSCPLDFVQSGLDSYEVKQMENQGEGYVVDRLTSTQTEDPFYDPMECVPFYLNETSPLWLGRVSGLSSMN